MTRRGGESTGRRVAVLAVGVIAALDVLGCVASRVSPRVEEVVRDPAPPVGSRLVAAALELEGTPYRAGGDTPRGFDCSGFTRYVFGRHGLELPRRTQDQFTAGHRVDSVADLRPGDLVFFQTVSPGPSHVGLALGDDRFIHAPSSRGRVRIERLSTRYWASRYLGARRIPGTVGPASARR